LRFDPTHADQRIASVLGRRKHYVAAALQPAQRAAQVRRRERGAIGADEDRRALCCCERAIHPLAEVFSPLQAEAHPERRKKPMPCGSMDFDNTEPRGERRAHGVPRQACVQLRRAPFAQPRHEARLCLPGDRRLREHDDHR